MFCSKCGSQLDINSRCPKCGNYQPEHDTYARKDVAVLTVYPALEQNTINSMACLGWQLETNQSLSRVHGDYYNGHGYVRTTYMAKLTFSRYTNIPNFAIRNILYSKFVALHNERMSLCYKHNNAINWAFVMWGIAIGIALFVFVIGKSFLLSKDLLSIVGLCILPGVLIGGFFGWLIGIPFMRAKLKKQIAEVSEEIDALCREALKYEI